MDPAKELLQQAIDRVVNISTHLGPESLESAQALLPEILKDLKAGFVAVTGENPWETP